MTSQDAPKKSAAKQMATGSSKEQKNLLFQKVAIFVDAENIEMSSLKHHEGRTDYKKILEKVGDREIIRVLYYKPAYKDISPDFESFWASLGGEIRRPTKNADTFLVIDAVTMAEKIDVAIILGGDKDFLPLIWYLRSRGCRVEIWSWPETTSQEMKEGSDFYFPLSEEFVMSSGRRSGGGGAERSNGRKPEMNEPRGDEPRNINEPRVPSEGRSSIGSGRGGKGGGGSSGREASGGRDAGGGRNSGRGGGGGNRGGSSNRSGGSRGGGNNNRGDN